MPPPDTSEPSLEELARRAVLSLDTTQLEKKLRLTLNGQVYHARPGDALGRQGTVATDQLVNTETVSRRHAIFGYAQGAWNITVPEAVLNATRLDGVELPRGQAVRLAGRQTLSLGSTVRITVEVID